LHSSRQKTAGREQALLGRDAVMIKRVGPIRHVDMVSGEPGRGFDPSGMEAHVRVAFEKGKG